MGVSVYGGAIVYLILPHLGEMQSSGYRLSHHYICHEPCNYFFDPF